MSLLLPMQLLMPGTWYILPAYSLAHWNLLFWQLFLGLIPASVPYANKTGLFQLFASGSVHLCLLSCAPSHYLIFSVYRAISFSTQVLWSKSFTAGMDYQFLPKRQVTQQVPRIRWSGRRTQVCAAFPLCLLEPCRALWPEWGTVRL